MGGTIFGMFLHFFSLLDSFSHFESGRIASLLGAEKTIDGGDTLDI